MSTHPNSDGKHYWLTPRKIFPCSMTDLFGAWVPDEWIHQIYSVMAATPQHWYIVLTKRSARRRLVLTKKVQLQPFGLGWITSWPLPNVIEMASFGRQRDADQELALLLQTPAAMRGASVEPMLEPISLDGGPKSDGMWITCPVCKGDASVPAPGGGKPCGRCFGKAGETQGAVPGLDWVICGGESGPPGIPRLFNLAWAENLLEQCRAAGVPFFMKQVGTFPITSKPEAGWGALYFDKDGKQPTGMFGRELKDRKGEDPAEWPPALRVREWPLPVDREVGP